MSYHTWTTYGFGFCVDDIDTTPEKLLKLAALKPDVLKDVREYLNDILRQNFPQADSSGN